LVVDLEPDDVEEFFETPSDSACDDSPFAHPALLGPWPVISTSS